MSDFQSLKHQLGNLDKSIKLLGKQLEKFGNRLDETVSLAVFEKEMLRLEKQYTEKMAAADRLYQSNLRNLEARVQVNTDRSKSNATKMDNGVIWLLGLTVSGVIGLVVMIGSWIVNKIA